MKGEGEMVSELSFQVITREQIPTNIPNKPKYPPILKQLTKDNAICIDLPEGSNLNSLRSSISNAASRLHIRIRVSKVDEKLYISLRDETG